LKLVTLSIMSVSQSVSQFKLCKSLLCSILVKLVQFRTYANVGNPKAYRIKMMMQKYYIQIWHAYFHNRNVKVSIIESRS